MDASSGPPEAWALPLIIGGPRAWDDASISLALALVGRSTATLEELSGQPALAALVALQRGDEAGLRAMAARCDWLAQLQVLRIASLSHEIGSSVRRWLAVAHLGPRHDPVDVYNKIVRAQQPSSPPSGAAKAEVLRGPCSSATCSRNAAGEQRRHPAIAHPPSAHHVASIARVARVPPAAGRPQASPRQAQG